MRTRLKSAVKCKCCQYKFRWRHNTPYVVDSFMCNNINYYDQFMMARDYLTFEYIFGIWIVLSDYKYFIDWYVFTLVFLCYISAYIYTRMQFMGTTMFWRAMVHVSKLYLQLRSSVLWYDVAIFGSCRTYEDLSCAFYYI